MSRRAFLGFSAVMASALALPHTFAPRIAAAIESAPRLPVIWLRGQDCAGDTVAFLRAAKPTVGELMLDLLSIEYHETIMAASGLAAEQARSDTMDRYPDGYIAVVEGAVPMADGGAACTIGGRAFGDIVREVCDGALATIAVGGCAVDGGAPAASGGATGAAGVSGVISDGVLVNLPGCPVNVENLTATIVHYLTFKSFPETDASHRPFFAYGELIHNKCERRPHFEFGEFVTTWGDEAAQKGWCLYKMGCKGPETYADCPTVRYGEGTSWAIKAGHGCIGCTMPRFWDAMSPFYRRLPSPLPVGPNVTVDQVGMVIVGGVAAATAAHGTATIVRERRNGGVRHASSAHPEPGDAAVGSPIQGPAPAPAAPAPDLAPPAPSPVIPPMAVPPPDGPGRGVESEPPATDPTPAAELIGSDDAAPTAGPIDPDDADPDDTAPRAG